MPEPSMTRCFYCGEADPDKLVGRLRGGRICLTCRPQEPELSRMSQQQQQATPPAAKRERLRTVEIEWHVVNAPPPGRTKYGGPKQKRKAPYSAPEVRRMDK